MASFVAPPLPYAPFYLSKGVRGDNGRTFYLFGHPIPNNLSQDFNNAGLTYPYTPIDPTTLFDVSSLRENQEVVIASYSPSNLFITSRVNIRWNWYRARDNQHVASVTNYIDVPPGQSYIGYSATAWIGWLSDRYNGVGTYPMYKEIQENGDYYVTYTATGGHTTSYTARFVVKGIPPSLFLSNETNSGFDWVARLSSYFDRDNYIRVGICTQNFTDGQSSTPSGIIDYKNAPSSNVGCAVTGTAYGLESGKFYIIYAFAQAANGRYYKVGSDIIRTLGVNRPSFAPTLNTRTEGGFSLTWGSSSNATSYTLKVRRAYDNYTVTYNTTSRSYTVSNLQYGVTYQVSARANTSTGSSSYTAENPVTTAPKTPSISKGNTTNNSISISVNNVMEGNYDKIVIERYSSSSVYIDTKEILKTSYDLGNRTVTWTNLPSGQTYIFKARSKFTVNSTDLFSVNYSNNLTITTTARPTNFSWDSSKYSGNSINITASEWNRLQDKINEFRKYKNLSQFSVYSSYNRDNSFTRAAYNSDIMAYHYNQCRNAINAMASVPITVSSGSIIYASDINRLRDSLNSIS